MIAWVMSVSRFLCASSHVKVGAPRLHTRGKNSEFSRCGLLALHCRPSIISSHVLQMFGLAATFPRSCIFHVSLNGLEKHQKSETFFHLHALHKISTTICLLSEHWPGPGWSPVTIEGFYNDFQYGKTRSIEPQKCQDQG